MDFLRALQDRRSVRSYKDVRVYKSMIQLLRDAAIAAPSAMNPQPWLSLCV
jgi:nitroreductase